MDIPGRREELGREGGKLFAFQRRDKSKHQFKCKKLSRRRTFSTKGTNGEERLISGKRRIRKGEVTTENHRAWGSSCDGKAGSRESGIKEGGKRKWHREKEREPAK